MSYFILTKDSDNIERTLCYIAENQSDLNNLNIDQSTFKIIEDSQLNFEAVKYGTKNVLKYNNNTLTYEDTSPIAIADRLNKKGDLIKSAKEQLNDDISSYKKSIKIFLKNNPNHPLFDRWNQYYDQLNSLNLDNITYPFTKSLEQYFKDLGQPSYNILQLP
jgi:hypothetical protein